MCLIYGDYVPKPVIGQFVIRLNFQLRGQAHILLEYQPFRFDELTHSSRPLSWWWRDR